MAARCYLAAQGQRLGRAIAAQEIAEAGRLARRAAELGRDDAVALGGAGMALAYVVGDLDDGAALIDRALALNPNFAWAWLFSGWIKVWSRRAGGRDRACRARHAPEPARSADVRHAGRDRLRAFLPGPRRRSFDLGRGGAATAA